MTASKPFPKTFALTSALTTLLLPVVGVIGAVMTGHGEVRWWVGTHEHRLSHYVASKPFDGPVTCCWSYSKKKHPHLHPSLSLYLCSSGWGRTWSL